jgi:hypothetical protein
MKSPSVTPIFPRNNRFIEEPRNIPSNLPIRKLEPSKNILNYAGFNNLSSGLPSPHNVLNYNSYRLGHHSPNGAMPSAWDLNESYSNNHSQPNCITIAQHVETCPICSRIYDTDKTLYILAIISLLILCFLMVKRIVKL